MAKSKKRMLLKRNVCAWSSLVISYPVTSHLQNLGETHFSILL